MYLGKGHRTRKGAVRGETTGSGAGRSNRTPVTSKWRRNADRRMGRSNQARDVKIPQGDLLF